MASRKEGGTVLGDLARGVARPAEMRTESIQEPPEIEAEDDEANMAPRSVRMPADLVEGIQQFGVRRVAPLTGRDPKFAELVRYLLRVGLAVIQQGHWRVEAEPSDRLRDP